MMPWKTILSLYEAPMSEEEYAAFLIRRYHMLDTVFNSKWIDALPHLRAEYLMCKSIVERLTEKSVQDVLQTLNNNHAS